MKILVVATLQMWNPFIETLVYNLKLSSFKYNINVDIKSFWELKESYDVIHLHWPELLFFWNQPSNIDLERLSETLKIWKTKTRIVYTRHNEYSHYANSINRSLYQIIEKNADIIVHLGENSRNQLLLGKQKQDQLHYVIPHHIYDTIYANTIKKEDARKLLKISSENLVILTFGAFRHKEEQMLVKRAFNQLNLPYKFLFAPSWFYKLEKGHAIDKRKHYFLGNNLVNHNILPYCFAVADIVFIQRLRILNSGILPMAFFFNKTVIGPNIGNVGPLLDNENNFSFNPYNTKSVFHALKKASYASMSKTSNNEQYALDNWSTKYICTLYEQVYNNLN